MITAGFESRCLDCGREIVEGDEIGMVDGSWVCEDCVEAAGGEDDEGYG